MSREDYMQILGGDIMNDRIGIIGIIGMGGVGKTTLLREIHKEYLQGAGRGEFEVVIWVTVSGDADIFRIQNAIREQLGLSASMPGDAPFRELTRRRFLLLLDDVWEKLDFAKLGIPLPKNVNNNSKILFTTRSEPACREMGADSVVRLSTLSVEESWELFCAKVGPASALWQPHIRQLAMKAVERCCGLPIFLITLGRAMADATTPHDWEDAICMLDRGAVEETPGWDITILKYCFDMLKDDTLQSCLLYCALFPEDYDIPKQRIIDYWIGEGFLDLKGYDEYDDIDQTRNRGRDVINKLLNACLLILEDDGDNVKLHDMVRFMALWTTRQEFVVLAGNIGATGVQEWESATRISLMNNSKIEEEPASWELMSFPNLTTLLLQHSKLGRRVPPQGFLARMPALRVLDLEGTALKRFPIEITGLAQLQHLNLSATDFTSLPRELGNLTNLRQLMLENTLHLTSIPGEAISRLLRLQVLRLRPSGYAFGRKARHPQLELGDLGNLKRLRELALAVHSWPSLEMLVASDVLRAGVRVLEVVLDYGSPSGAIMSKAIGGLAGLRQLELCDNPRNPVIGELEFRPDQLPNLDDLSIRLFTKARISVLDLRGGLVLPKLRHLLIDGCHELSELKWVCRLPCLEKLRVRRRDRW